MAGSRNSSPLRRWIISLCVLALIGVFGYDGVTTAMADSSVTDSADQIAHDAANYYHSHPDVNATYNQALAEAQSAGDTLPTASFMVTSAGAVSLTLERANKTVLLGHIHPALDTMTGQATESWNP